LGRGRQTHEIEVPQDSPSHPLEIASVAKKAPLPTGRQVRNDGSKTVLRSRFLDREKQSHFFFVFSKYETILGLYDHQ